METVISRLWHGFDQPSAKLQSAKSLLSYPSRHVLSKHPHSHPSDSVPRGHRGRQNRQHSTNGWKVHKVPKRSFHSTPYKPHGVGTWKHFFGSKSKKPKRFMICNPKKEKGGGSIFDPPHPPHHLHHLPENLKKVGFTWGGFGGVRTKNSLGDVFIGQNYDFTRG